MSEQTPEIITQSAKTVGKSFYVEQKEFKEVDRIEPKRCFVISQTIRKMNRDSERYLPELTHEEFRERLQRAKKLVLALSEQELDKYIAAEKYPKRLRAYNSVRWYKGLAHANEVGVWKGAGGLPREWTQGSLAETVSKVLQALQNSGNKEVAARAKRAIPRIRKHLDIIEAEQYLYPIILPGATMGRGLNGRPYKQFQLMKGDIDDGCMRAITLVSSGKTAFRVYIGIKQLNQV